LWSSNSQLVIAPMQDFLGLDDSSRMNTPATLGNNWIWRVDTSFLDNKLSQKISILTKKYNR
ncbi:MAG: 4-alpha-glucanotransferase, partial [Cetobacterium sp.]